MLLARTIAQLDIGDVPNHVAIKMGHLGYVQWLGALKGDESYLRAAMMAYELARPRARPSPAVAVFCDLLLQSTKAPLRALELQLPKPARRGGAKARRNVV